MARSECRVRATISSEPIEPVEATRFVADPRAGALATFTGTVRNHHADREVAFLEYEGYATMAERSLAEVAREAAARWPLLAVAIEHRLGRLAIGDAAVTIAVSAAHRAEAFDGLRYVIDTLKQKVPIWKRETGPDGEYWIEGPEMIPAASDPEAERPPDHDGRIGPDV